MTDNEKHIESARRQLEEAALNYARMKASCHYLEGNIICRVNPSDQQMYIDTFVRNMQSAARELLDELMAMPLPARKVS
jgi:hypothetical protein